MSCVSSQVRAAVSPFCLIKLLSQHKRFGLAAATCNLIAVHGTQRGPRLESQTEISVWGGGFRVWIVETRRPFVDLGPGSLVMGAGAVQRRIMSFGSKRPSRSHRKGISKS